MPTNPKTPETNMGGQNLINSIIVDAFVKAFEDYRDPGDGFRECVRAALTEVVPLIAGRMEFATIIGADALSKTALEAARDWITRPDVGPYYQADPGYLDLAMKIDAALSRQGMVENDVALCKDGRKFLMELATIMGAVDVCAEPGETVPVKDLMPLMLKLARQDRERWHALETPAVSKDYVLVSRMVLEEWWKRFAGYTPDGKNWNYKHIVEAMDQMRSLYANLAAIKESHDDKL